MCTTVYCRRVSSLARRDVRYALARFTRITRNQCATVRHRQPKWAKIHGTTPVAEAQPTGWDTFCCVNASPERAVLLSPIYCAPSSSPESANESTNERVHLLLSPASNCTARQRPRATSSDLTLRPGFASLGLRVAVFRTLLVSLLGRDLIRLPAWHRPWQEADLALSLGQLWEPASADRRRRSVNLPPSTPAHSCLHDRRYHTYPHTSPAILSLPCSALPANSRGPLRCCLRAVAG
jgi:hypothetical protein